MPGPPLQNLRARAETLRTIRHFFDQREYFAAETPQLARTPIPEAHIELFATELLPGSGVDPPGPTGREQLYLLPSPEYYLKQLLAAGSGSLYEITHSFRNAESLGPHHNPEFTMLEYYTVDADGIDSLEITIQLLQELGEKRSPLILTMREAWLRWTGIDLAATLAAEADENRRRLGGEITARGLSMLVRREESWEDLFQRVFLSHVEPQIPRDRPVFITQYPAAIPTLARRIPDTPWSDRWELYLSGLEVANCFGEETDPERIREFTRRDDTFLQPPETLPRCSGVALGVDRLVMHILGEEVIQRVISFPLF